jgi:hypothetical protein
MKMDVTIAGIIFGSTIFLSVSMVKVLNKLDAMEKMQQKQMQTIHYLHTRCAPGE